MLRHACARCGASCEGLRVQVHPEERARIEGDAVRLGVPAPFEGDFLRQEGGQCVFHDAGCRLHAELGSAAKPAMCSQFPFVYSGPDVGLDPSCFHADPSEHGEAPQLAFPPGFSSPPDRSWLPWLDLSCGQVMQQALASRPLATVLEGVGPLTRALLIPLVESTPEVPNAGFFETRVRTALQFALVPTANPVVALVGGSQLIAGAGLPPGPGFAAWMRLLRMGVL